MSLSHLLLLGVNEPVSFVVTEWLHLQLQTIADSEVPDRLIIMELFTLSNDKHERTKYRNHKRLV